MHCVQAHPSLWDMDVVTCATGGTALTKRLNFQVTASRAHKAFSVYSHLFKSSDPILHEQDHKPVTKTHKPMRRTFDDATKHTNHATVRVAPSAANPVCINRQHPTRVLSSAKIRAAIRRP